MILKRILAALLWLALSLAAPAAQAQTQAPTQPPASGQSPARPGAVMDARLDAAEARLHAIRLAARAGPQDDASLKAQQAAIAPVQADLADALASLTPRLQDTQARLAELGPAPASGQPPESPDLAVSRTRLVSVQKALDGNSKRARLLSLEASQLSDSLANRLQQNFSARLWARGRSFVDPALWADFAEHLPGDLQRIAEVFAGQAAAHGAAAVAAALLLALSFLLLAPARVLLGHLGRRWATTLVPSSALRKSALALWLTLVGALTPLLAGLAARQALAAVAPLTPVMDRLAGVFVSALFFAATIEALGRSLLSPGRPSWRLAPAPDAVVDRLAVFPAVIGLAVGLATFTSQSSGVLDLSPAVGEVGDYAAVLIEIVAVGCSLMMLGRARDAQAEAARDPAARSRLPWILAAFAAWVALAAALVAVLAGYLALAAFVMRELIWIGTVLASLFLLLRFADDLCQALFLPGSAVSRLLHTAVGFSENALDQIGVLLSGLLRLTLLLFGWMAIVAPFGASARDVFIRATSTKMVLKLGQLSISPGLILGGAAVFALGLAITRVVRRWLETTYLPKTSIDVGLRTSITAGLTYLGALVALLTTCAYLGLSLDRIALFASALSVGIGFGLQAVIGNFVSGLILLAERPVKVGDWIAIGDLEGDVRRINIRATEIEMRDRSKLIVPNSDLISKTVRNVTRGDALGQVRIVVKVANDADAEEVRDLLHARLSGHPEVLREPAPGVYLTNVPDGALEFTAVAAVASAREAFRIRSDLLFGMVAELKARGVKLSSSSTVIHLPSDTPPLGRG